ncbi:hypothetical protein INR49_018357 [Caranx melampygus]|nr:hypothetical protein INR49_018357 [Caranx melampygus]
MSALNSSPVVLVADVKSLPAVIVSSSSSSSASAAARSTTADRRSELISPIDPLGATGCSKELFPGVRRHFTDRADTGGLDQSSLQSEGSLRRSEESRLGSEESRAKSSVGSWESELTSIQHSLKFVLKLKEEFVCPICKGVVLNPQQNSCGHIYCFHCLQGLLFSRTTAANEKSPVWKFSASTPHSVPLSPRYTTCRSSSNQRSSRPLQEHLRSCQYEQLQCTNPGCRATLQRRHLQEHLTSTCPHRMEPCQHCRQPLCLSLLQDHVRSSCPDVEVDCPNSCSQKVPRHKLTEHRESCPEVQVDCSFKKFGCSVQKKITPLLQQSDVHEHAVSTAQDLWRRI